MGWRDFWCWLQCLFGQLTPTGQLLYTAVYGIAGAGDAHSTAAQQYLRCRLLTVATNIGNVACNTPGFTQQTFQSFNFAGTFSIATLHPRCRIALLRSTACTLIFLMAPSPWEAGSLLVPTSVKVFLNIRACSKKPCAVLYTVQLHSHDICC